MSTELENQEALAETRQDQRALVAPAWMRQSRAARIAWHEEQRVEAAILDAAITYNEGMMTPDYDRLAAEESVTQNGDNREAAEAPGAQ